MKYIYIALFYLILHIGGTQSTFAQQYPVDCRILLAPPYSADFGAYASSPIKFRVQLLLRDFTKSSLDVTLRLRLSGAGVRIENPADFISTNAITLTPGVPKILSGAELADNFNLANLETQGVDVLQLFTGSALPVGPYTWEAYAIERFRDRQVSNIAQAYMVLNQNNPPLLNSPQDQATLTPTQPQSILFNWTPRHTASPNTALGVVYTFYLYEIPEGEDPQQVANGSLAPLRIIETSTPSLLYGPAEYPLKKGLQYAWQVQVADLQGKDAFTNNGYSQVHSFRYGKATCLTPTNATANVEENGTVRFTWDAVEMAQSYALQLTQAGQAPQTISTTDHTHLLLQQPAGETFTWKVASRCAINDESAYTAPQTYTLPADAPDEPSWIADPTLSFEDEEEWETPTQETGDETGETDGDQPSEEETPNLDDLLNTPVTIITAPEGTDLPEGLPSTISQLPPDANTEQLQEAMKSLKPTCAGMVATYVCGSHDGPPQYAGEKISVAAGDDIAMNSLILSVVNIDGGGNGAGLIKIPMMNNIKLGVTLSGIQVAKGGCIVAGRAELSGVSASILNDQQREQLAKIYTAYMAATQLGIDNAGAIAKSYNTFAEKLNGIKDQANALVSNLKGGKAKQKEVEALKQLTESTTASMQTTLDAMRKAHGENINKEIAAELQKNIDANKVSIATLTNFKIGRDDPAVATAAANTLAVVDPVKTEKDMKTLGPLAVEYNGKVYENGKTVKINPESLDGIIQGSSDIPLNCGFFLKNSMEGEAITWKLQTAAGTELPLEPPMRVSVGNTDAYLGIKWPDGQAKLKLTATNGSRSVSLNLEKPVWYVKDLKVSEKSPTSKKLRNATAGQTLYLVQDNSLGITRNRKPTYSYSTNLDDFLLKKHITHHNYLSNTSTTLENGTGPYNHRLTFGYDEVPASYGLNINAVGYDKTVKVQLVPFDKREDEAAIPASILVSYKKIAKAVKDFKNYKSKLEEVIGKTETGTSKEKGLDIVANGQTYNEEDSESKNYFAVREWELKLAGSIEGTFKYGATSLLPNALSKYIDLYAYAGLSLDVELIGGEKWAKANGVENEKRLEIARKVQIVGGAKIGATAKMHAGSVVNVDLDAHGKGEIEGGYNFATAKGYITLKPIVFNFSASVTSFDIEILKYNYIKNLTNEYPIYNP